MKLIIAGGRDFQDFDLLKNKLDSILSNTDKSSIEVVSGGANGADALGEKYARQNSLTLTRFPADWDKHGRSAGMLRNKSMAEYATHCVVFWDGCSKGTANMIMRAAQLNLVLRVIRY